MVRKISIKMHKQLKSRDNESIISFTFFKQIERTDVMFCHYETMCDGSHDALNACSKRSNCQYLYAKPRLVSSAVDKLVKSK